MTLACVPTPRQFCLGSGSRSRNEVMPSGRNIKLEIEYDGTFFCGWQIQNRSLDSRKSKKESIQGLLENNLSKILREKIKVVGSGRTDSGVHALGQVANFRTDSDISLEKIKHSLNSLLPAEIAIKNISCVKEDFHSRYQVKSKVYRYLILNQKYPSVFQHKYSWHVPYDLNLRLMKQEAKTLLGEHDFKSFCASGSSVKNTVRNIKRISIKNAVSAKITIEIEADGFLYNMVRNIVGTLVEIGRGKFKEGSLKKILSLKDRKVAGLTAPPWGLFLVKVNY